MASDSTQVVDHLALWQSNFKKDVLSLLELFPIRTNRTERDNLNQVFPLFSEVDDTVKQIENTLDSLEEYVERENAQAQRLLRFQEAIAKTNQRIALIKAHLPPELSHTLGLHEPDDMGENSKENHDKSVVNVNDHPDPEERVVSTKPVPKKGLRSSPMAQSNNSSLPKKKVKPPPTKSKSPRPSMDKGSKKERSSPKVSDDIPQISSVSQSELDSAPQYVKGRMTLDKIEPVVEKFNEIADLKYALISRPFRELASNEINQVQDFRESECSETDGKYYLTDAEIKGFGAFRMDAKVKSVINILRHVGSLKEIRGKNKVRIFIINES